MERVLDGGADPPQSGRGKAAPKWAPRGNSKVDITLQPVVRFGWNFCPMMHTKVPAGLRASKLEPEVEFRRHGAFFRIPFWWHISAADQDIFTFGVYIDSATCEWSKYAFLHSPRWRTTAILNYSNRRYRLLFDFAEILNDANTKVPEREICALHSMQHSPNYIGLLSTVL